MHNQLSSPRYTNLFKRAWYKSDYIEQKPEKFDNPVTFRFGKSGTLFEISGCSNVAIIKCSWCQK